MMGRLQMVAVLSGRGKMARFLSSLLRKEVDQRVGAERTFTVLCVARVTAGASTSENDTKTRDWLRLINKPKKKKCFNAIF